MCSTRESECVCVMRERRNRGCVCVESEREERVCVCEERERKFVFVHEEREREIERV